MNRTSSVVALLIAIFLLPTVGLAQLPSLWKPWKRDAQPDTRGSQQASYAEPVAAPGATEEAADERWWQRLTPSTPKLALPSPTAVWETVDRGTRTVWSGTKRVVTTPWTRLRQWQTGQEAPVTSDRRSGLFGWWNRDRRDDQQAETIGEWLSQPRPGFQP